MTRLRAVIGRRSGRRRFAISWLTGFGALWLVIEPLALVIEDFKTAQRVKLIELCRAGGLREPDMLADELSLLLEGARVSAQSVASNDLGTRLVRMGEAMIAAHAAK